MKGMLEDYVAEILRRALRGEVTVYLHPEETQMWNEAFCEPVDFVLDGYRMRFSNNCNQLNHLDYVVSPDGQRIEFFTGRYSYNEVLRALSPKEVSVLEQLLKTATWAS